MVPDKPGGTHQRDEEFFSILSAYDDHVVEGSDRGLRSEEIVPAELRGRLRRAQALLHRLEHVGRRSGSGSSRSSLFATGAHADGLPWSDPPKRIERFEIRGELGHGGFGIVLRAWDPNLRRDVALKVPKLGSLASRDMRDRFLREAWAAAALDHPNIISVYEAGGDQSVCYIASAYCSGPNLAAWLKSQEKPLPVRLAAWITSVIARGVEHAHSRDVLHRDIKPSNVLLEPLEPNTATGEVDRQRSEAAANSSEATPFAADFPYVPKLTDFGLAKIQEPGLEETKSTMLMGTVNYMSPEQAAGKSKSVGPSSDVYSLGAILYELLVGQPPLVGDSDMETLLRLRRDEPPSPRRVRPTIPRDLETICLKCLAKEPQRRYPTAQSVVEDLDRFLRGEPIVARPTPMAMRSWRWSRRNPLAATFVAMLVLLAVIGPLVALNQTRLYRDQLRLYGVAVSARAETRRLLYTSDMNLALQAWEDGNVGRVEELLHRHKHRAGQTDLRGFVWYFLWQQCQKSLTTSVIEKDLPVYRLAVSPDGSILAVGAADHLVELYSTETRRKLGELTGHDAQVISLDFSPDGTLMATASWDRTVRLWDVETRQELLPRLHRDRLRAWDVAFAPNGKTLAAALYDGTVQLWDVETRETISTISNHITDARCVAFSPNGRILASCGLDGAVTILDLKLGTSTKFMHRDVIFLAFSPSGDTLALAVADSIEFLDSSGSRIRTLRGHRGQVLSLAFSRDGTRLASGGMDNSVKLWNTSNGEELTTLKGHLNSTHSVAFSSDGQRLFSGGLDGSVKEWKLAANEVQDTLHHPSGTRSLAFSPAGRSLVTACNDGLIRLWDVESGKFLAKLEGHQQDVWSVKFFSHGGQTIVASASEDGTVKLWDLDTRRLLRNFTGFRANARCLAVADEAGVLAWAQPDNTLRIWSYPLDRDVATVPHDFVHALELSPDGRSLAAACADRNVRLWDVNTASLADRLTKDTQIVRCLRFSSDSSFLITGGQDRTIRLWDARPLRTGGQAVLVRTFAVHPSTVLSVAFEPSGRLLASGAADQTIRLWDLETGEQRGSLKTKGSFTVAFSPDGKTLASGGVNGTVTLWRAASEEDVIVFESEPDVHGFRKP